MKVGMSKGKEGEEVDQYRVGKGREGRRGRANHRERKGGDREDSEWRESQRDEERG